MPRISNQILSRKSIWTWIQGHGPYIWIKCPHAHYSSIKSRPCVWWKMVGNPNQWLLPLFLRRVCILSDKANKSAFCTPNILTHNLRVSKEQRYHSATTQQLWNFHNMHPKGLLYLKVWLVRCKLCEGRPLVVPWQIRWSGKQEVLRIIQCTTLF